jgi:hypothetical protein
VAILYAAEAADPASLIEVRTFWVAVAALAVSLVALGTAVWSAVSGHRSANYAKSSAEAAKDSAGSSKVSARAAEKSADADGKVAQVELDRDHEAYRPTPTLQRFVGEEADGGGAPAYLELIMSRTYRVTAEAILKEGRGKDGLEGFLPITPGPVMQPGQPTRFHLTGPETVGQAQMIRLHFYPPNTGDAGERWQCRCGKPMEDPPYGAHWLRTIPVPRNVEPQ